MIVYNIDSAIKRVEQQLLYIVYGNDLNYQIEVKLSILSVLRNAKESCCTIRILTDNPNDYEGWPVEVIALDAETLNDWLGDTHYHYRRKLMGLLTLLPYAERTVFLDTDTVVQGDIKELFAFSDNQILVDTIDGTWQERRYDSLILKVSEYLLENHPQYDLSIPLINSGVLGFVKADITILKQAVGLLDELWPIDHNCRVLEQFCLAICINKQKDVIAHNVIYHYWSRKEFFQQMGRYYFKQYGYVYQSTMLETSKEIPEYIIRPTLLKRLWCRLKVRTFSKKQRSGILKLLYAVALGTEGYEGKQKIAYWQQAMCRGFSQYNTKAYEQFQAGHWPTDYKKLIPESAQQCFLAFLTNEGLL